MVQGKSTGIAAIALLLLALGLAGWLAIREDPAATDKKPGGTDQATANTTLESTPQDPNDDATKGDLAKTKLSERQEGLGIRDLEKHGIIVDADHVGKNSATGNVRVTVQGGVVLEAERAKMNSKGMLIAEGNPTMANGESRIRLGNGEGAMAVYFDEKKQTVMMKADSAIGVTMDRESNDPEPADPDLGESK